MGAFCRVFRRVLLAAAAWAHRATLAACLLALALAGSAQLASVVLRYGFGLGYLWLNDLAAWSFATLIILSLPVALALDANVRVDILRARQGARGRAAFDRLAIALLLAPLFVLLLWALLPQIAMSWRIGESSGQIGGLPFYFLIRSLPALAAGLMLLQGAARFVAPAATTQSETRP